MNAEPLTLGTAGHIDHGKTTLIRALTGVDTDRLPEERTRGISIELGYARLQLPSGQALSVVDVPGHERFVRTMVAGATGIDLYLMTIAADDGVMPQTREHAAVLAALGVDAGVVAVTKRELVDPEPAMLAAEELLPGAEVVAVSARTGDGLQDLRRVLELTAESLTSRAQRQAAVRLHVDRTFTIRGAGTVVTGTLWSGAVAKGDELQILPGGRRTRVRGVQVHDDTCNRAQAGQRVALNLVGVAVAELERGSVLASPDSDLRPTYVIDAALELGSDPPEHGARVQVHHGTRESAARLAWLGGRFWQLRLERPFVACAGDRVVVRRIAPPDTLGGGTILDPRAKKHGPSRELLVRLARLPKGEPGSTEASSSAGRAGQLPRPSSRKPPAIPPPAPPAELTASQTALEQRLRGAGIEPPLDSELDAADLAALRSAGRAVRVSRTLHYHPEALAQIGARVIALAQRNGGSITLGQVRDELGTSRKFAQALLEHLDAERITIRRGEQRYLRPGARPVASQPVASDQR